MPAQKDNSEPRRPGRPRGGKRVTASREQLLDIPNRIRGATSIYLSFTR